MTTIAPTRRRRGAESRSATNAAAPVDLGVITRGALRWQRFRRFLFYCTFAGLALALLAVAGVHAELVQGQQEIDQLDDEIQELRVRRATLQREVDEARAPGQIIQRATALGMVRAEEPVYLSVVSQSSESQ